MRKILVTTALTHVSSYFEKRGGGLAVAKRTGLFCLALGIGALLSADPAFAQGTTTSGLSGWVLSLFQNTFGNVPSVVAYGGLIGGAAGTGMGVYSLYHHVSDGGRLAEKTTTVLGTGLSAALMTLPLLMNTAQQGANAAGGSATLTHQSVTVQ